MDRLALEIRSIVEDESTPDVLDIGVASDYKGGEQRDWIVMDWSRGNLFCLALTSDGAGRWRLDEWVNFFGLSMSEMSNMVNTGYGTMLLASANRDVYWFGIFEHAFQKASVGDVGYFHEVVPDDVFYGKATLNVPIDMDKFMAGLGTLRITKMASSSSIVAT